MYTAKREGFNITNFVKKISPEEKGYIRDYTPPKVGSLFLVMSQSDKYLKFEKTIKNFFQNIYTVHMAKDYMQDTLSCVCEKIEEADFGVVIIAGLKERRGNNLLAKMNIPFEYGMLRILNKPVMIIREEKNNLDLDKEFSDVKNENWGEKCSLSRQQRKIDEHLGKMFKKFVPELARKTAIREVKSLLSKADFSHSDEQRLSSELKKIYEAQIFKDFTGKIN